MEKIVRPFVSICTPTFNRRPFIPFAIQCFLNQDYPKDQMEWIIIDDGTDKVEDMFTQVPQVKYFKYDEKMSLGKKRNIANDKSVGDFIIYMDDDDYYPPTRISHAVEMLEKNPHILCAGSSEMHLYFKHIQKMYKFGPYGPNHATAATFAFRRELLSQTRFHDDVALAEEKIFLKNYTIPFVQLDSMKTILVFSHIHNSFDKKILLKDLPTPFITESTKTVDDFIQFSHIFESDLKKFFMEDIDELLQAYNPGDPSHKKDVMTQLDAITKHRTNMANQQKQYMDILKKLNINPNDSLVQKNSQTMINADAKINEMSMVINELLMENNLLKDKAAYFENKIKQLIAAQIEERKLTKERKLID
jgi:glycosyltransferase involved in cell wall biosynthesis